MKKYAARRLRFLSLFIVIVNALLYCALVHPELEYGSFYWDPSTACACAMVERVQRKCFRITAHRLNISQPSHDYMPVLRTLNISTLANLRHASNLSFLSNLLSTKIDFPSLLSLINFRVLIRTIYPSPFYTFPYSSLLFLFLW